MGPVTEAGKVKGSPEEKKKKAGMAERMERYGGFGWAQGHSPRHSLSVLDLFPSASNPLSQRRNVLFGIDSVMTRKFPVGLCPVNAGNTQSSACGPKANSKFGSNYLQSS